MESGRYDEIITYLRSLQLALAERSIPYHRGELKILYVKQLVDKNELSRQIVKPLIQYCAASRKPLAAQHVTESVIYAADCQLGEDEGGILAHILNGMAVIIFSTDTQYVIVNLKKVQHRPVTTPEITYTIRGPRDCFVENMDVNLALIRYRLQDPSLRIDMMRVGKRTQTGVAVIYLEDVAKDTVVAEVKKRIEDINIDSIWGTGELQQFLQGSKSSLFPRLGTTERSDWACEAVIEGRVLILADGGHLGLIAPQAFGQFMTACDDRYDNKFFGLFSHIIRYIALFITLCLSSVYIAVVSYHLYVLPFQYVIMLAQLRQNVLFSPLIEVLFLEMLVELIRESMLRVPDKIGAAVGIVGAIVIGQAASVAGIFSPLLLIVVAAELMASFAIPDYFAAHPFRILKFLVILMTGFFGFYGFTLAITVIFTAMVSQESFGIPYMAPIAPYNRYDFFRSFMFSRSTSPFRQRFLRTKDSTRTDEYHRHFEP